MRASRCLLDRYWALLRSAVDICDDSLWAANAPAQVQATGEEGELAEPGEYLVALTVDGERLTTVLTIERDVPVNLGK